MNWLRVVTGACLMLALGVLSVTRSHAEIEKIVDPDQKKNAMVLMWWPKVAPPDNWVHQRDVSYENHINMFVPKGQDFADAPAVMYARAIYYEKGETGKELERAIRDDHAGFQQRFPDSKVEEVAAVKTGDGTSLRTFSFTPASKGNWEIVAYGREPKYVLMFCLSANSKEALEQNRAAFLTMVRSYTSRDDS
jgi:hypothetical protein